MAIYSWFMQNSMPPFACVHEKFNLMIAVCKKVVITQRETYCDFMGIQTNHFCVVFLRMLILCRLHRTPPNLIINHRCCCCVLDGQFFFARKNKRGLFWEVVSIKKIMRKSWKMWSNWIILEWLGKWNTIKM